MHGWFDGTIGLWTLWEKPEGTFHKRSIHATNIKLLKIPHFQDSVLYANKMMPKALRDI